jgi:hypothetical protein
MMALQTFLLPCEEWEMFSGKEGPQVLGQSLDVEGKDTSNFRIMEV